MHRQGLLESLKNYTPLDEHDQKNLEALRAFIQKNPHGFDRNSKEGHVTASAWILNPAKTAVLLTHHKKLKKWIQLGGHCDGNPDTLAVALREAKEESGIEKIVPLTEEIYDIGIHEIPEREDEPAHVHYDVRYLLQTTVCDRLHISDESIDLQWVPLKKLADFPADDSALKFIPKWKRHIERTHQPLIKQLQQYEHVIWDWNGTLLNDMELVIDVIGEQLIEQKLPVPSISEYRNIFAFPVIDYYKKLGFSFEKHSFHDFAVRYTRQYEERVKEIHLFDGAREMLEVLVTQGMHQSILSAAMQEHLEMVTAHFQVRNHFSGVYGVSDCYGASKVDRGKDLINESHIPREKTILVGDTDHDLAVGKELGIEVLLIADGHQSYDRLQKVHPNVLQSRYSHKRHPDPVS